MLTALFKLIFYAARQFLLSTFWLPLVFAQLGRVRRIERLTRRLNGIGQKIRLFLSHIRAGHFKEAIDADVSFRAELNELKEDLRALRRQVALWQEQQRATPVVHRLHSALAALSKISEEVFTMADQLAWEIAEHDGRVGAG